MRDTYRKGRTGRRMLLLATPFLALMMMADPASAAVTSGVPWSCVPYARKVSNIDLQGDAWRWWTAAQGVYARGQTPKPGSVLVFQRTSTLRQGHVAVVRQVVNNRRIVVDHANWDRGRRKGRIDAGVQVMDVSPGNDWTAVRVWYTPVADFGTTSYPTHGFIYSAPALQQEAVVRQVAQPVGKAAVPLPLPRPSQNGGTLGAVTAPATPLPVVKVSVPAPLVKPVAPLAKPKV